jgi:hypothetical protein
VRLYCSLHEFWRVGEEKKRGALEERRRKGLEEVQASLRKLSRRLGARG